MKFSCADKKTSELLASIWTFATYTSVLIPAIFGRDVICIMFAIRKPKIHGQPVARYAAGKWQHPGSERKLTWEIKLVESYEEVEEPHRLALTRFDI